MVAELKADPYGSVGGMYNIKTHTTQLQNAGSDMLWTNSPDTQPRPVSPPIYHPHSTTLFKHSLPIQSINSTTVYRQASPSTNSAIYKQSPTQSSSTAYKQVSPTTHTTNSTATYKPNTPTQQANSPSIYKQSLSTQSTNIPMYSQSPSQSQKPNPSVQSTTSNNSYLQHMSTPTSTYKSLPPTPAYNPQSYRPASSKPRSVVRPLVVRKPLYKVHDNGDGVEPRLPSIDEHSKLDVQDKYTRGKIGSEEERLRLRSCPERTERRAVFYRRAGDGLPRLVRCTALSIETFKVSKCMSMTTCGVRRA